MSLAHGELAMAASRWAAVRVGSAAFLALAFPLPLGVAAPPRPAPSVSATAPGRTEYLPARPSTSWPAGVPMAPPPTMKRPTSSATPGQPSTLLRMSPHTPMSASESRDESGTEATDQPRLRADAGEGLGLAALRGGDLREVLLGRRLVAELLEPEAELGHGLIGREALCLGLE